MNTAKTTSWGLVLALIVLSCTIGCRSTRPPELRPMEKSLRSAGFYLWYPARDNTHPGEIWRERPSILSWFRIIPEYLIEQGPNELRVATNNAVFITSVATNAIEWTLGADILGDVAPKLWKAEAELRSATVTSYSINYGKTRIEEIPFATFKDKSEVSRLSPGYRQLLRDFNRSDDDQILITAVVKATGLRYEFKCEDAKKLDAKAAVITKLINAQFKPEFKGTNLATWNIPTAKEYVVGVRFYTAESFELPEEKAIDAFKEALAEENAKSVKATAKKVTVKAKRKK